MKEAWQYQSPIAYFIVRRIELSRWVFRDKIWHPLATWRSRIRALILILRGHETEICCICGGAVGLVWWCKDNALWERLTEWKNGDGVCCIRCFDELAQNAGLLLLWSAGNHARQAGEEEGN
jgi:hypothetical protein